MIKVVSGQFTEAQLVELADLANCGHVRVGKNHVYLVPTGLSWVSHKHWLSGDYDAVAQKEGNVKLGVVRFAR